MPLNYIGSKGRLLSFIDRTWSSVRNGGESTVCDLFAGTGVVGQHFARLGYRVVANDLQHYAYVLNAAYLSGHGPPSFARLLPLLPLGGGVPVDRVLGFLNAIPGLEGFLARQYGPAGGRLYFTRENAERLDAVRAQVRRWHEADLLEVGEHEYLLACLLEAADRVANTASVYNAYLKRVKATARQNLRLRQVCPAGQGVAFHRDANDLVGEVECDLLYLDPPYNSRQYGAYYHVLETISLGDEPPLSGVTGMRDYPRSRYSRRREVRDALADVVQKARAGHILVSYNDEGLLSLDDLREILSLRGDPQAFTAPLGRFKADSARAYKRESTVEYLHYVRVTR